jgi:hypothetical protein
VDIVDRPAWWGDPPEPIRARSIVELVGEGVIDAELAALLWVLVEGGLPLVVAGGRGSGRTTLLGALLAFVDPAADVEAMHHQVAGSTGFGDIVEVDPP